MRLRRLYRFLSYVMGRPPLLPLFFRFAAWSAFSGITALIPCLRR